jgi:hypothetical protein
MKFALITAILLTGLTGCDKRTPEEKGRDYADEKLGFVEGAAGELKKRGKNIGERLGKGVGDLVKGTGSAVKDVAHPPVKVTLSPAVKTAGLSVGQANEGEDKGNLREVVVHLKADKEFSGKLSLEGQGDAGLVVRTLSPQGVDLAADGTTVIRFAFDESVRLSKIAEFSLELAADKEVKLETGTGDAELSVSQLREEKTGTGYEVSLYAVFGKKFSKKLSLRAFDGKGSEVGRSSLKEALAQDADSATYVAFEFDPRVPMTRVKSYQLFVVP